MITQTTKRSVEVGGTKIDAAKYHIDTQNIQHITQVLRDMYSKPFEAVAREYVANAVDAHVEAGCPDKAIDVTLPSVGSGLFDRTTSYNFIVRDYGTGLNLEDTRRLLFGYGASGEHKRMSNDQIGGFGVGCKCGFAVADQFSYRVFHKGKVRVWRCYLDDHDMGQADLLEESASSEPTGIEISIPIQGNDASKLVDTAKELFTYLPVPVNLIQGAKSHIANERDIKIMYEGALTCNIADTPFTVKWRVLSNQQDPATQYGAPSTYKPKCILGGYAYPLDISQLDGLPESSHLYRSLELELPVGYVPLAPNRESIKYTRHTIRVLEQTVSAVINDLVKQSKGNNKARSIDTYRLIKQLDGFKSSIKYPAKTDPDGFDMSGIPHELCFCADTYLDIAERDAGSKMVAKVNIKDRGLTLLRHTPIVWTSVQCSLAQDYVVLVPKVEGRGRAKSMDVVTRVMAKHWFENWSAVHPRWVTSRAPGRYAYRQVATYVDPDARRAPVTIVLVPDGKMAEAQQTVNALPFVKDGSLKVLVATPEFDDDLKPLVFPKSTKKLPENSRWLAEVIVENKQHENYQSNRRMSTYAPQGRTHVAAHSRKLVELKPGKKGSMYVSKASDAWTALAAKDVKGGVYVPINRFQIIAEDLQMASFRAQQRAASATKWCRRWLHTPLAPAKLLGVRTKDLKSLENDASFMPLYTYVEKRLAALKQAGTITEDRMAHWAFTTHKSALFVDPYGVSIFNNLVRLVARITQPSVAKKLKGTKLLAQSQLLHKYASAPPTFTADEDAAYTFIWELAHLDYIQHAMSYKLNLDKVLTPAKTAEGNMLRAAIDPENVELRMQARTTQDKKTGGNLIQDWINLVRDTYPLLSPLVHEILAGSKPKTGPYTVDFDEYIPYITGIG